MMSKYDDFCFKCIHRLNHGDKECEVCYRDWPSNYKRDDSVKDRLVY